MNLLTYLSPLNTGIVVSKEELDEAQIIYNYLKSGHCRYRIIPNDWLEAGNDLLIQNVLEELINEMWNIESF
jgi:excinuclease ABC subunit C